MGRTSQGKAPEPSPGKNDFRVVLIDGSQRGERIGAVLAEQGFKFDPSGSVEELLASGVAPALVVLSASENLGRVATRDLEPLCRALPDTPVIVVCASVRPGELRMALAAGASGVVLDEQLETAFGACLQAVRAGQVCVPKQDARQVEPAALSAREKQILGLVVMGYMNSEIAAQLFVAESTVKSHLSSAFGKLGVHSRNEAVDLILDPERGLGMGILELGGERIESGSAAR